MALRFGGGYGVCFALAMPLLSVECLWGWLSGVVPEGCWVRGRLRLRSEQEHSEVILGLGQALGVDEVIQEDCVA